MTEVASGFCAVLAVAGLLCVLAGVLAVRRFAGLARPAPQARPPVTILRPLCGAEPGLDAALDSLAGQSYPAFQIVLGLHEAADPAHDAALRFAARHPTAEVTIVVDPALHGANRKISNLINMLPSARHGVLVFSDSDLHVAPDYLDHLVAALELPGTGLATTLCVGRPARAGLAARLTCLHMRHCFLPGALIAHWAGRQDCLGNTMALQRGTLARIGGLPALVDQLADDNVLGQLVTALGLRVVLARTVPAATISESTMAGLWQHELRWARTIRSLVPLTFASSALQFPLFWAFLACLLSPGQAGFAGLLVVAYGLRVAAAGRIDAMLATRFGVARQADLRHLLVLRDAISVIIVAASYLGRTVTWRGHRMQATGFRTPVAEPVLAGPA